MDTYNIWDNVYKDFNDLKDLSGCKIELMRMFENKLPLALNHWIGIWRITKPDGSWEQFLVNAAAGKNDAWKLLEQSLSDELFYHGKLDPEKNTVIFKTTPRKRDEWGTYIDE